MIYNYILFMQIIVITFLNSCAISKNKESNNTASENIVVFKLINYQNSKYIIPDIENVPVNCEKISNEVIDFQKQVSSNSTITSDLKNKCSKQKLTCSDLNLHGFVSKKEKWGYLKTPLYTMVKWDELYADIPLKVNTVFFEVEGFPGWPHKMPCTNVYGYNKSTDGGEFGSISKNYPFDYFVINEKDNKSNIEFLSHSNLTDNLKNKAKGILSGFILLKNGIWSFKHRKTPSNPGFNHLGYCNKKNGRTLIGINNQSLYFIYVTNVDKNNNGMTCKEAADYAQREYNINDLFLLDCGGSSNLFIHNQKGGNEYLYKSPVSDAEGYRPIPGFLGVIPDSMKNLSRVSLQSN